MSERATPGVLFSWRSQGATRYVFQLARDAEFKEKVVDTSHQETSVEVMGLAEGTYYWQVTGVSEKGEQGPFGDACLLTVRPAGGGEPAPGSDLGPHRD